MPRRDAAATSIVFTPAPARTISARAPASSIDSVTFVERTTSTSAPLATIRAASCASARSGSRRPSQPAAFRPSRPDDSSLSATRTLMGWALGYGLRATGYRLPATGYHLDHVGQQAIPQLRLEPGRLRRHDAAGV